MDRSALLLIAFALMLASPQSSWACSYDGQFSNPFSESYPGSLDVAISTQEAIRSQSIEQPESLVGVNGLRRASWWLNVMVELYPQLLTGTYIYLVDSQLWSHHQTNNRLAIHVATPSSDSEILLISEAALHNLVNESITLNTALELGIARRL